MVIGQISHGFDFGPYKSSIGLRVEFSVVFPGTEANEEDSGTIKGDNYQSYTLVR